MKPLIGTILFATGVLAGFGLSRLTFESPDPTKPPIDIVVEEPPTRLEVAMACNYKELAVLAECRPSEDGEEVECALPEPRTIPLEFKGLTKEGCVYGATFPNFWNCDGDKAIAQVQTSLIGADAEDIVKGPSIILAPYGFGGCNQGVTVVMKRMD